MALALNNGYPRVDVESLLFDVKELLRTSLQVNKAQAAEIARLGGKAMNDLMVAEYEERVHSALSQVDAALDAIDSQSFEAASTHYEFDVLAWINNTNKSLGLTFEDPEAVVYSTDTPSDAVPMSAGQDVPNDFWNVNSFKWEDEPLSDDGSDDLFIHQAVSESPQTPERDNIGDEHFEHPATLFPNGLVPDEQIPEIMLDGSDRSSTPRASSNSNFDDSATLYHPEDSPTETSYLSHRRRHTLVSSKLAAIVAAHKVDYPAPSSKAHIFPAAPAPQTGAPPTPNHRPFALGHMRTSSAPDLRALRGPHDIILEEEHMLLSAF